MSNGFPDRYQTLEGPSKSSTNPLLTRKFPIMEQKKKKQIPQKVVDKLEATELKDDNDTETSLKYNFSQLFSRNKNIRSIILLFLDTLLIGVYFILIGYTFSWFVNTYTVKPLELKKSDGSYDPKSSKGRIFSELILECLLLIIVIYLAIQIGLRLPLLIKKAPLFHRDYRIYSGGILLIYTLMSVQTKMIEKARYVFDSDKSNFDENMEQLLDCAKKSYAGSANWTGFRDCIDKIK